MKKCVEIWKRVRVHVLLILCGVAATANAWNDGLKAGVRAKIGGSGEFRTAIVEWQDYSAKKVLVYLNDGGNGYAFWITLDNKFRHYTASPKVFVCNNEDPEDIKEKLETVRDWCRNDREGGDTRIVGGELDYERPETVPLSELDEREWQLIKYDRECLSQARKDISDLVIERDLLRAKIVKLEGAAK